jgi:hypothetical protein
MIDAAPFGRRAAHEGEVLLAHRAVRKALHQCRCGVRVETEHQSSARTSVQAVHRKDPQPERVADEGLHDDFVARPAAVDHETRWFVDDDVAVVAIENRG